MSYASCDWSKGITPLPDGSFKYSSACHLAVGQLVQDNSVKDKQIVDLSKAIQLKDLAIQQSDARANLWMNTSATLEQRLQKVDSMEKTNSWVSFGLGALTVLGAGWMASQLIRH